ncbi:F-box/kelch-repeat protein At3g23880-like isoform X2 [Arachis ipaensis]|uniref:F-box/kelch-repeat protein At3g23880-like n=1 Tax=Arachis hypogaea TaxID=3818 RepID=UPI0007AF246C|nr:F-box/kelch-repeat protein At3g23880-like isoform X2 [Arachis ipaensis]
MGSCRGFLLFNEQPHFLVIWNPLTGSSKTISYSHIVSRIKIPLVINPDHKVPYGFGFDASRDDYLVVLSWPDNYNQHHLDCFSLRTNSWINLDAALPKSMGTWKQQFYGLFLHGAIHWLCYSSQDYIDDAILIFDLKERSFSKISMPKQLVGCSPINLTILGGCLALYWYHDDITEIWVMKEYKVPSSWILICEIPCGNYLPLCISNGSNIIALNFELGYCVHTDSLLPFPGDVKDKDKKKKTDH